MNDRRPFLVGHGMLGEGVVERLRTSSVFSIVAGCVHCSWGGSVEVDLLVLQAKRWLVHLPYPPDENESIR
jgi:hypothetical protein